ncbi:MAG: phosphate-starvation-inducible PsiE family protein [Sedimenticolaceae bacterium]|nr:phosphate-starvation-inducible PsiE family protein [Sedimenticolaceae bacterium]
MKEMNSIERFGDRLIEMFHLVGLFVIGGTIVWSAIHEYIDIMSKSHAGLDDILLLFIYLELGAMTGIFFRTHRLPVIFLLFIAMTAVTRYLAIDLKELEVLEITTLAGCILVLSVSVLVLRYSEKRFVMDGDGQSTETL